MNILNAIKQSVESSVKVELQSPQYNKLPAVVTDTSQSVTSGWSLLYRLNQMNNGQGFRASKERFDELKITGFSQIYQKLTQTYARFKQGDQVQQQNSGNYAVYEEDANLRYSARQKGKGVNITLTVMDESSPFYMLAISFFVVDQGQDGAPYLIGMNDHFDQQADVFSDRQNANMLPNKRRYVPIIQRETNGPALIRANGTPNGNGQVAIDTNQTDISYVQEIKSEYRMIAGLYEKMIIKHVEAYASDNGSMNQQQNGFQSLNNNQSWNANNPSAQMNQFNQQQNGFQNQQQTAFDTPNQNQNQNQGNAFQNNLNNQQNSSFAGIGNHQQVHY